jgi:hypothetical protein
VKNYQIEETDERVIQQQSIIRQLESRSQEQQMIIQDLNNFKLSEDLQSKQKIQELNE